MSFSSTILVPSYLHERSKEVKTLVTYRDIYSKTRSGKYTNSTEVSRTVGRVHHRTRSFKSYKLPKKLKRVKKRKNEGKPWENRCRKHKRRTWKYIFANEDMERDHPGPKRLRSHVWHKKRMVMEDYYGYRVSMKSRFRGMKSLDKTLNERNVIHDFSYYQPHCIECIGSKFKDIFSSYMDPENELLSFLTETKLKQNSSIEFEVILYEKDQYPNGMIGPVQFTLIKINQMLKALLWVHPSIQDDVSKVLIDISQIEAINWQRSYPLCRLWLHGPTCSEVLLKTLQDNCRSDTYSFINDALIQKKEVNVWHNGHVLPLSVRDPRLNCESHQNRNNNFDDKVNRKLSWPKSADTSPIWSKEALLEISTHFKRDFEINREKQRKTYANWVNATNSLQQALKLESIQLPSPLNQENDASNDVPLLVIRHGLSKAKTMIGKAVSSWSLIIPNAWMMVFWIKLQKLKTVAIGVEEYHHIRRRHNLLSFPNDFPDSRIGWNYWNNKFNQMNHIEMKRPPGKRRFVTSIQKSLQQILSVSLDAKENDSMSDSSEEGAMDGGDNRSQNQITSDSFLVIRNYEYLRDIIPPSFAGTIDKKQNLSVALDHDDWDLDDFEERSLLPSIPSPIKPLLVHVTIKAPSRGMPYEGAILYIPTTAELKEFMRHHLNRKCKLNNMLDCYDDFSEALRWRGSNVLAEDGYLTDRLIVGVVTSGYAPHTNKYNSVIALCNLEILHTMIRRNYGRFSHPLADKLLLFLNPRSNWFRPGLYDFL